MVYIDVNVEHPIVVLEQLKNGNNDIIDIAKATSLFLLGMVEPPCPVDTEVSLLVVQHDCGVQTSARRDLSQLEHAWETWTVSLNSNVEFLLRGQGCIDLVTLSQGCLRVHLWHNGLQVLDVVFTVEGVHFADRCSMRLIHIHLLVQSI